MPEKPVSPPKIGRRALLSAVAATSATPLLPAQSQPAPPDTRPKTPPPSPAAQAAETLPPPPEAVFESRSGSDYMVDVIKALDIDYIATMAGSSFRGLHESLINYGNNTKPELLTCLHEEIAVGIAHGYAKVTGKPMAALVHGVVGLQHAAMAIYNAWCDRVPMLLFVGNAVNGPQRREGVEWAHSALDNGAMVRDFVKWDAQPGSLEDFSDSLLRAHALATSPPYGPVLLAVDGELQERAIADNLRPAPKTTRPTLPVADSGALAEAAMLLARAQNPVIVADRLVRTPQGMANLVALAELLQCPVIDRRARLNMPTGHYLNQTENARAVMGRADVILGLELVDAWGTVNTLLDRMERVPRRIAPAGAKLVTLSTHDLLVHSNFQDFERYQGADLAMTGDGEASLPALLEAVRRALPSNAAFAARGDAARQAHEAARAKARDDAVYGWDASPVSVARLCAELWPLIKDSDWAFVGANPEFQSGWPFRLWDFDRHYRYAGPSGGAGVGYGGPGGVGAALAHRAQGRLAVNILGDGELMCAPATLWTAVHHKIPLLTVMHNNRAYHQELMHVQRMADRHARGAATAHIGTAIDNPAIDYAKLAGSMGMWASGPISDPNAVAPALKKAIDVVKRGEPALVDIVCQPR